MRWLSRAFAVEPPGPTEPSDEQRAVVDRVCREVVRRQLVTPALMFLEMSRPLNYITAQTLHFFAPFVSIVAGGHGHRHFAAFLEQRGSIEYMVRRIEELEAETTKPGGRP